MPELVEVRAKVCRNAGWTCSNSISEWARVDMCDYMERDTEFDEEDHYGEVEKEEECEEKCDYKCVNSYRSYDNCYNACVYNCQAQLEYLQEKLYECPAPGTYNFATTMYLSEGMAQNYSYFLSSNKFMLRVSLSPAYKNVSGSSIFCHIPFHFVNGEGVEDDTSTMEGGKQFVRSFFYGFYWNLRRHGVQYIYMLAFMALLVLTWYHREFLLEHFHHWNEKRKRRAKALMKCGGDDDATLMQCVDDEAAKAEPCIDDDLLVQSRMDDDLLIQARMSMEAPYYNDPPPPPEVPKPKKKQPAKHAPPVLDPTQEDSVFDFVEFEDQILKMCI